jgi:hypothetical protein
VPDRREIALYSVLSIMQSGSCQTRSRLSMTSEKSPARRQTKAVVGVVQLRHSGSRNGGGLTVLALANFREVHMHSCQSLSLTSS